MSHNGILGELEHILRARIQKETDALVAGRATDWVDYKVRVERIKEANQALQDIHAAVKAYLKRENEDDDDEPQ